MAWVICGVLATSTAAHAGFLNGGFEEGLNGWSFGGDVLVVDASIGVTPTEGSRQVILTTSSENGDANTFSGNDAITAAAIEEALGLSTGALAGGVEGSFIAQTISAVAGDTIAFDFNFLSTEGANLDFAFVLFGSLTTLANPIDATLASAVVLDPVFESVTFETGYRTMMLPVTTSGTYLLALGVVDVGDEFEPSALLVDHVRLIPIPEPTSFAMLGIGLVSLLIGWRRRLG